MKKTASYFITMILILSLCVSTASAITPNSINASLYLDSYTVMIDATGGGQIEVYYDAAATSIMTQIGASCVVIQEKHGSTWYGVGTYYASSTSGMLAANTSYHDNTITYNGTSAYQYRAVVTIYAANANGSDSRTVTTSVVTA